MIVKPWFAIALALVFAVTGSLSATASECVRIVIDHELPPPAQRAVDRLSDTLGRKGFAVATSSDTAQEPRAKLVIGIAGESEPVDGCLSEHELTVPEQPESLLIARVTDGDVETILLAGRDARGLAYAVLDAAEAIRTAPPGRDPLAALSEARESPYLRVRSVTTQLFNEDVERPWYESEEYWHWFFSMLATNRFNNYSLTFGHNTNYMVPPYPWMLAVPEYPDVRVKGVDDAARHRNLRTLQRISEIAQGHGGCHLSPAALRLSR